MYFWTVVVVAAALIAPLPPAQAQIPAGPEAPLGNEFRAAQLDDVLARTVEVYKRITPHDDAHREQAIEFLTGAAHWLAGSHDRPDMGVVIDQGLELASAGCTDGLVHWAIGYLIDLHNHWEPAEAYWYEAFRKVVMDGSPYSLRTRAHALSVMAGWTYHNDGAEESRSPWDSVANLLAGHLRHEQNDGSNGRMLHAAIAPIFTSASPVDALQKMADLVKEHIADEWARESLLGVAELTMAWSMRGHGDADSVSLAGWRGFRKHLLAAQTHLLKAYELAPDRPEAATYLIAVSRAGYAPPGTTARHWFDRAVQAEFDYLPAYEQYATTLSLRWGGSEAALDGFANECIDTARYDTRVPLMALEAYAFMERDLGPQAVWSDELRYDNAMQLFRRYAEQASQEQKMAPRSAMLFLASHVGDWALAERLDAEMDGRIDRYIRWKFQVDYPAIKEGIAAYRQRRGD